MLTICLIDDEADAREMMLDILSTIPDCRVIGEAANVAEAQALLKNTNPDVVFLDIDLSDGTGFDVLESLSAPRFSIIFVTAFNNFALKAFKANALDYLLKPVMRDDVINALEKVRRIQPSNHFEHQFTELLSAMRQKKVEKLLLQTAEGIYYVPLDEVLHLASEGSYTTVSTVFGAKILVSKYLGEFEYLITPTQQKERFSEEASSFFRVHQSHIVNIKAVRQFLRSTDGQYAVLSNGTNVPIARRCKDAFLEVLKNG
jgi:two-component system, LytTR family, response regulator